jgi:iron-sulfur cluster repair protein YtfE (RIC family)
MNETSNWLVHDHRKYDAALDECELEAGVGEWKNAIKLFKQFIDDLKLHMRLEEEVLYPFFVEHTGDSAGAIAVLIEEHEDLARLLSDLIYIIKTRDFDHFLDSLVPLHKVMKEHNQHEEDVFQRMASDSLLLHRDEIIGRLKSLHNEEGRRTWEF